LKEYKVPINNYHWILNDLVSAPAVWVFIWAIVTRFWSYDLYHWISLQPWGKAVPSWSWVPKWASLSIAQAFALHFKLVLGMAAIVLSFLFSWNPNVPGPGRQIFIIWRRWKVNKVLTTKGMKRLDKVENPVFPPTFNSNLAVYMEAVEGAEKKPAGLILGFQKRLRQDIDFQRRHGEKVEEYTDYFPLIISDDSRTRNTDCVGGSGSGKTASVIAAYLDYDTNHPLHASVCFNPKGDDYLFRVAARRILDRRSSPESEDLAVMYQDYLNAGGKLPRHVWALKEKGIRIKPFALVSVPNADISLGYDPLEHGDADAVTKKIIYSADSIGGSAFYLAEQQTWLLEMMNLVLSDPDLKGRISLEHLHWFATDPRGRIPKALSTIIDVEPERKFPHLEDKIARTRDYNQALDQGETDFAERLRAIGILTQDEENLILAHENNRVRYANLRRKDPDNLSGLASHISLLVGDQSIRRIFTDSTIPSLNIREVIDAGGIVYVEVPTQAKGPQSRAISRMLMMELQLLSADRASGVESKDVPVAVSIDECGSLLYNEFVNYIDKSRGSNFMTLLAHQSLANFSKAHLDSSFSSEIMDNTANKIILSLNDVHTQEYFAKVLGETETMRRSVSESAGSSTGGGGSSSSPIGGFSGHKSKGISQQHAEVRETVVSASDLATKKGTGYARILTGDESSERYAITLNYISEKGLPPLEDVIEFAKTERLAFRPKELPYFRISPTDGRLMDPYTDKMVTCGSYVAVYKKLGRPLPFIKAVPVQAEPDQVVSLEDEVGFEPTSPTRPVSSFSSQIPPDILDEEIPELDPEQLEDLDFPPVLSPIGQHAEDPEPPIQPRDDLPPEPPLELPKRPLKKF
jgi:hypothetical protein